MTIDDLVRVAENRTMFLQNMINQAIISGDADAMARFEQEMAQTQETLTKIKGL